MLLAIRDFLRQRQRATLGELASHLQQPVEVVRGLLSHWIRKARVSRGPAPAGCGTRCQTCPPEQVEVYHWHESPTQRK